MSNFSGLKETEGKKASILKRQGLTWYTTGYSVKTATNRRIRNDADCLKKLYSVLTACEAGRGRSWNSERLGKGPGCLSLNLPSTPWTGCALKKTTTKSSVHTQQDLFSPLSFYSEYCDQWKKDRKSWTSSPLVRSEGWLFNLQQTHQNSRSDRGLSPWTWYLWSISLTEHHNKI